MKFIIDPDAAYKGSTYFRTESPTIDQWIWMSRGQWMRENRAALAEAIWWCRDQFGRKGRWFCTGYGIVVHDPVAATAFRLRWC